MKTAVQLRTLAGPERPRAELLFGTPYALGEGRLGPVARFESSQVVAYQNPEPAASAPLRLSHARGRRCLRRRRARRPPARSTPHGARHGGADPARREALRVPRSHGPAPVGDARHLLPTRRRGAGRPAACAQDPALAAPRRAPVAGARVEHRVESRIDRAGRISPIDACAGPYRCIDREALLIHPERSPWSAENET